MYFKKAFDHLIFVIYRITYCIQWYHLSMLSRRLSQVKYVQACKATFGKKHRKTWYWGFNRRLLSETGLNHSKGFWGQYAVENVIFQKKLCKTGSYDYLFHFVEKHGITSVILYLLHFSNLFKLLCSKIAVWT